jgi:hypothetical protein
MTSTRFERFDFDYELAALGEEATQLLDVALIALVNLGQPLSLPPLACQLASG